MKKDISKYKLGFSRIFKKIF